MSPPSASNRSLTSGDWTAPINAVLSLSMISGGVPLGAIRPNHAPTSKPGMEVSASVGTFGKEAERSVEVMASAFSFPPRVCECDA